MPDLKSQDLVTHSFHHLKEKAFILPPAAQKEISRQKNVLPRNTYFLRVEGNSMEDARIHDGDVLVVDRALEPEHGSIVIAAVDNEVSDTLDLR
ncbi:S24 family peptidase, partial [Klebsiella pneumoniae]